MKVSRCAMALAAALAILANGTASGADLDRPPPRRAPPPAYAEAPFSPALRWAGLYAGVSVGAAFNDDNGFAGAATLGYNWATPYGIVYGLEGDVGLIDISDRFSRFGPFWGSFRGRVGYAMGNLLPYATYGLALIETDDSAFGNGNDIQTGWVAGLGVEMALFEKTSVKFEYLHMDFGDSDRSFVRAFDDKVDLIRVGLNYKF